MEDRLLSAQRTHKFDLSKCPLLSKPGELYKRRLKTNPMFSSSHFSLNQFDLKNKPQCTVSAQTERKIPNRFNSLSKSSASDLLLNTTSEIRSSCLRFIYPNRSRFHYNHLFILEQISDIFICFTLHGGYKFMTHFDFRLFVR